MVDIVKIDRIFIDWAEIVIVFFLTINPVLLKYTLSVVK
jgi:hypothetical protein